MDGNPNGTSYDENAAGTTGEDASASRPRVE